MPSGLLTVGFTLSLASPLNRPPVPPTGPYNITRLSFNLSTLDSTSHVINAVYPAVSRSSTFPLVVYAHGFDDAGYIDYTSLFDELASWGYVVVCALSCKLGCRDDCVSKKYDPPCFGHYYLEQLMTARWAQASSDAAVLPINHSAGIALAGHSMGGQATLFSAAFNASGYNVKAVALHHAFTHSYPAIDSVPFLAFTGELDDVAPPRMANAIFDTPGACATRGL
eukprot:2012978-Prymnesium_polylepis.1